MTSIGQSKQLAVSIYRKRGDEEIIDVSIVKNEEESEDLTQTISSKKFLKNQYNSNKRRLNKSQSGLDGTLNRDMFDENVIKPDTNDNSPI